MNPIIFDMDGVLVNFRQGFAEQFKRVHGTALPVDLHTALWDDFLDKETWKSIKASSTFWRELSPLATADDFRRISTLRVHSDVYFVTARPGHHVLEQTKRWLFEHGVLGADVILSQRKGDITSGLEASFLIDDKAGNCVYVNYHSPKTKVFIYDAPHNAFDHRIIGKKIIRVYSISEFLDCVEGEYATDGF